MAMYSLYSELKAKHILVTYCGARAQEGIEGIGDTIKKSLEAEETEKSTSLTVFSIFIEQVQNILNYSAEKLVFHQDQENELRFGIVVIGRESSGKFYVCCGNKILKDDIDILTKRLNKLNALSKEELKLLYKQQRRNAMGQEGKGSGLGLIEMARRASEPIEYSFEPTTDQWAFFSIKVIVGQ